MKITKRTFVSAILVSLVLYADSISAAVLALPPPKLVLFIVIDQFRADTLAKYRSRFMPAEKKGVVGGFNYLLSKGAYYPLAEYEVLQSMTGPGHSTLLTGARPALNGIAQNNWFDQKTQQPVYCVEDPGTPIIGNSSPKAHAGATPKWMLGTTVGDELKNSGYSSRVYTVALKDRAAILMGGQRPDLALWHDPVGKKWVTSKKYIPSGNLPTWVEKLNQSLAKDSELKGQWLPDGKSQTQLLFSEEATLEKKRMRGSNLEFPHEYTLDTPASLRTPYGVKITVDAAIAALESEGLGKRTHPDLLAISISTHDYVAHTWGPNSKEAEEITAVEDREISRLLNRIQKHLPDGLRNVDIVLSADHGGTPVPEYMQSQGVPAGRIDEDTILDLANQKITEEFGSPPSGQKWVPYVSDFAFYLNHPALEKKGSGALSRAESLLKKVILDQEGVFAAYSYSDWVNKTLPPGELSKRFYSTYFPGRSGDVMLIPKPYWVDNGDTTSHLTSWSYDRYVPLILSGPHFKSGTYAESAKVVDIAPTLSFLLRVTPPSLSEGRVLSEALR